MRPRSVISGVITDKLERLPVIEALRRHRVEAHWTNIFGIAALASLGVLILTGIVLTVFYSPSSDPVSYDGSYAPLHGAEVSRAFASTVGISFDVRGGLLIRQAHHWAALLLPAAVIGQLVTTFFTGGFRGRRQWAWLLLFGALVAALAAGWSGYALPDDMLSGTGLVIVRGIVLGIPLVGTWTAALLFGDVIRAMWVLHLLFSAGLVAVVALRLRLLSRLTPLLRRGADAVPALAVWVRGAVVVIAVLLLVSATVTVSPVWLYGPSDPGNASAGSQPDWYTGFLDGALRLVPPGWELDLGGYTLTLAVLVPLAVVGLFLGAIALYPFAENRRRRTTGRYLDRARDVPDRTALGAAGMTFYGVLWGAASADLLAHLLRLSLEGVVLGFQVLAIAGPAVAYAVTRRICLDLQQKDRDIAEHGYETGRIVRLPGGEYVEVHAPAAAAIQPRDAA
jgi:ubiquinol-cytochrome c reductase cytochrome b subunit